MIIQSKRVWSADQVGAAAVERGQGKVLVLLENKLCSHCP